MLKYLKVLWLVTSVLAGTGAYAQEPQILDEEQARKLELSVLGGLTRSSIWQSEHPDLSQTPGVFEIKYDRYEQVALSRGSSAIAAAYWFSDLFGIEGGASYQIRGGTTEEEYELAGFQGDGYVRRTVAVLSFPVGFSFRALRDPIAIDISVGVDYAIPLASEIHEFSQYVSPEELLTADEYFETEYEDDIGLYGSLSLKYWIHERIALQMQAGLTQSLTLHPTGVNMSNPLIGPDGPPYQRFLTYHILAGTCFSF